MQELVVINGEADWQRFFPGMNVHQRFIQQSQWLLRHGQLWVIDAAGTLRVDAVLWRLGAVRPQPSHRTVIELIRLAGIPCVNRAETLLRGYDRLAMCAELAQAGLPVLSPTVALGDAALARLGADLPAVVKVGNFHGGWGKALATTPEQWEDITSLAFAQDSYAAIEPYLTYRRDLRCLMVAERHWGMARAGSGWKANTQVVSHELVTLPERLITWTRTLKDHLGASIIAVDFLELDDGSFIALEYNDTPGFSGFPNEARQAAAGVMRDALAAR